jgi:hypothetical protein
VQLSPWRAHTQILRLVATIGNTNSNRMQNLETGNSLFDVSLQQQQQSFSAQHQQQQLQQQCSNLGVRQVRYTPSPVSHNACGPSLET